MDERAARRAEPIREKLDRFELISELASGGMATVYLARLVGAGGFQRFFAIKRLHPHLARDGEFIQMFLDEARLAARIHHPNVVPIQEIGTSESGYYLVMDLVEGDTEARLFARAAQRGTKIPPGVGIRIALDVLAGLHAAHELRDNDGKPLEIVHRDVSPQNILVGVDGVAKLTDFGVARAASRLTMTKSGQLKGKLAYMAPEQGKSKQAIDRRADVFAMGIVLWETLAFRRLFRGESEAETLNRVLYEPIPRLRAAAPTVPTELDAIVMKALERDPDKRFASAAELADALEKAAHALHVLGTTRDVAACVNDVMGTELEAQREVVRAWLARSEPSQTDTPRRTRVTDSVTRVERAAVSSGPPPGQGGATPSIPNGVSSVSSVSSAVVTAPPSSGAQVARADVDSNAPDVAPRARTGAWSAAVVAASLLLAWGVVAWRKAPHPPGGRVTSALGTPAPNATPPPVAPTSLLSSAAAAAAEAPIAPPSAASVPVAGAASTAGLAAPPLDGGPALARGPAHPRPRRLQGPALGGGPSPAPPSPAPPEGGRNQPAQPVQPEGEAPPAVPDDITRNPYR